MGHAILSPSSAHRWLVCTPSARFEQKFENTTSQAAAEGTLAHSLGELLIRQMLKNLKPGEYKKRLSEIQTDPLYQPEMLEYCEQYADFVFEKYAEALSRSKDAVIFLERKVNLRKWVPEGEGTTDVSIISDGLMDVIDLKYGKGVSVSSVENKQMKLYALGNLDEYAHLYDVREVRATIYQPRINNISSHVWGEDELIGWAITELTEIAAKAFKGEGEHVAGAHCKFCRAAAVCKTNAEHNLEIARFDFQAPEELTAQDISDILFKADDVAAWLKTVYEYALKKAKEGEKWPGWKLVSGRSARIITDEEKAAEALKAAGFDPYDKPKFLGIGKLETLVGKNKLPEIIGNLIIKPEGAPTLAPVNDKRPELNSTASAQADFAD